MEQQRNRIGFIYKPLTSELAIDTVNLINNAMDLLHCYRTLLLITDVNVSRKQLSHVTRVTQKVTQHILNDI